MSDPEQAAPGADDFDSGASGPIEVRVLGPDEAAVLARVAPLVFDGPLDTGRVRAVLGEARQHLAVAIEARPDGPLVVGMATALDYVHPDKPREMWIDEIGVAPTHRGRGIGQRLLEALFDAGRRAGCRQAWVLTERANRAARALFESVGGVEATGEPVLLEFPLTPPASDGSED